MKSILFIALAFTAAIAFAQEEDRGPGRRGGGPPFEAIQECATELGITIPSRGDGVIANGSRPQIADADREKIHQCLQQKRAARGGGQGPSEEDRAKVQACLTEKGVTIPEPSQSGERPRLDEASRKAMRECIESVRSTSAQPTSSDSARRVSLSSGVR